MIALGVRIGGEVGCRDSAGDSAGGRGRKGEEDEEGEREGDGRGGERAWPVVVQRQISVVDLDIKPFSRIPHWTKMDAAIVRAYEGAHAIG